MKTFIKLKKKKHFSCFQTECKDNCRGSIYIYIERERNREYIVNKWKSKPASWGKECQIVHF